DCYQWLSSNSFVIYASLLPNVQPQTRVSVRKRALAAIL
ncbi:hypothetical protein AVDCRST_MAG84-4295, partial [uncultured Microcoleus sp.]